MNNTGVKRNTYNIVLDGWAQRGDLWEAEDLLQQMLRNGTVPDIHSHTSFVNACCKAGYAVRATESVDNPNLQTYTILVHGWSSPTYPEKTSLCFEELKRSRT